MDLTTYINQIQGVEHEEGSRLLFRGQSKSKWPLYSAAARRLIKAGFNEGYLSEFTAEYIDYHRHLLDKADRIVPFGHGESNVPILERLAELQHFGIATGLLDFTWNPLNALWFAVSENRDSNGSVFILDDSILNTDYVNTKTGYQELDTIFSSTISRKQFSYFLMEPKAVGDAATRIINQKSVFLIGRPIVNYDYVTRVDVRAGDKLSLLRELEKMDITNNSIYRDLHGLSKTENHESAYTIPRTHRAYVRRAIRESRNGNFAVSLDSYNKAISLDPSETSLHYHRGNVNSIQMNYTEAISDYTYVIDNLKDIKGLFYAGIAPQVYLNRGNVYSFLKNYAMAESDYKESIKIDPGSLDAEFNLGNLYFKTERFDLAVDSFHRVLETDGIRDLRFHALMNLALSNVLQCNLIEARDTYINAKQVSLERSEKSEVDSHLESVLYLMELLDDILEDDLNVQLSREEKQIFVFITHPNLRGTYRRLNFAGICGNVGNAGAPLGVGWPGDSGVTMHINID